VHRQTAYGPCFTASTSAATILHVQFNGIGHAMRLADALIGANAAGATNLRSKEMRIMSNEAADRLREFLAILDQYRHSWYGDCICEEQETPLNQRDIRAVLAERDYLAKKNMDFNQLQEDYDKLAAENAALRDVLREILPHAQFGSLPDSKLELVVAFADGGGCGDHDVPRQARAVLAARKLLQKDGIMHQPPPSRDGMGRGSAPPVGR